MNPPNSKTNHSTSKKYSHTDEYPLLSDYMTYHHWTYHVKPDELDAILEYTRYLRANAPMIFPMDPVPHSPEFQNPISLLSRHKKQLFKSIADESKEFHLAQQVWAHMFDKNHSTQDEDDTTQEDEDEDI